MRMWMHRQNVQYNMPGNGSIDREIEVKCNITSEEMNTKKW